MVPDDDLDGALAEKEEGDGDAGARVRTSFASRAAKAFFDDSHLVRPSDAALATAASELAEECSDLPTKVSGIDLGAILVEAMTGGSTGGDDLRPPVDSDEEPLPPVDEDEEHEFADASGTADASVRPGPGGGGPARADQPRIDDSSASGLVIVARQPGG